MCVQTPYGAVTAPRQQRGGAPQEGQNSLLQRGDALVGRLGGAGDPQDRVRQQPPLGQVLGQAVVLLAVGEVERPALGSLGEPGARAEHDTTAAAALCGGHEGTAQPGVIGYQRDRARRGTGDGLRGRFPGGPQIADPSAGRPSSGSVADAYGVTGSTSGSAGSQCRVLS